MDEHKLGGFRGPDAEVGIDRKPQEAGKSVGNEQRRHLHFLPDIIKVIKSRKMRWAEHVACVGKKRILSGIW